MRLVGGAILLVAASPACTFTQLADYSVQACTAADEQRAGEVSGAQAPDACDRLNEGDTTSCISWQCEATTGLCVRRTRDDDRDGNPPTACGGGDCDDTDPTLNSLRVAAPTTRGAVSLEAQTSLTVSYDGINPIVAFTSQGNNGACVSMGNMESSGISGCTANAPEPGESASSAPAQPYGLESIDGLFATAFVATSGCPVGAIGFDFAGPPEVTTVNACGAGAALPALVLANGRAAVAYYATTPLPDPLTGCSRASAASLTVTGVANVGSVGEQALSAKSVLTTGAVSVRPPGVLLQSNLVLVASPDGAAASIWALDGQALTTTASGSLPALGGARAVSIAARTNADGTTRVAVIAEIGCSPQAIHVALTDYDPKSTSFTPARDVELSPAGTGFQTTPTIAWSAARGRWLATWVAAGPEACARFIDDDAKPTAAAFLVANQVLGAVALANAHVSFVAVEGGSGAALMDSAGKCP